MTLLDSERATVQYRLKRVAPGPGAAKIGAIEIEGTVEQLEALIPAIEEARRLRDEVIAVAAGHGFGVSEPRITISPQQVTAHGGAQEVWEDERP